MRSHLNRKKSSYKYSFYIFHRVIIPHLKQGCLNGLKIRAETRYSMTILFNILFAEGEVIIGEYSPRRSRGEYSP